MAPKRVDKERRREDILDAAVRVFARKGFAASRIDDVAAEAGIAKGSVYLYFDNREELRSATFDAFVAHSRELIDAALTGPGTPLDRLRVLVTSALGMFDAQPDLARVLLDLCAVGVRADTADPLDMAGAYREYRQAVTALFEEAERAGQVRPGLGEWHAAVIIGAIEGCGIQWMVDPSVPVGRLAEPLLDLVTHGLAPREEQRDAAAADHRPPRPSQLAGE